MKRQIMIAAGAVGAPREFIWIQTPVPVPDQDMSNIDHTCGQY
jgi:hypothetical protein